MKSKGLIAAVGLLIVVGLAGFAYRNLIERPVMPQGAACTLEARMCPDGTGVGRVAPDCNFAQCAAPNVIVGGVVFLPPEGLSASDMIGDGVIADFVTTPSSATSSAEVVIHDYPIPSGDTAEQVMSTTAIGDASGAPVGPTAFSAASIGGNTYSVVVLGRFEGVVHVAYYLPRAGHVLRFDSVDRGVLGWTNPNLDVSTLPAVRALRAMLSTLESA
jgi:hypothetical protein